MGRFVSATNVDWCVAPMALGDDAKNDRGKLEEDLKVGEGARVVAGCGAGWKPALRGERVGASSGARMNVCCGHETTYAFCHDGDSDCGGAVCGRNQNQRHEGGRFEQMEAGMER